MQAPLPGKFVEPVLVELVPGGSKMPVTPNSVQEYVRYIFMVGVGRCMEMRLGVYSKVTVLWVCHGLFVLVNFSIPTVAWFKAEKLQELRTIYILFLICRLYSMFMMVGCVQEKLAAMTSYQTTSSLASQLR